MEPGSVNEAGWFPSGKPSLAGLVGCNHTQNGIGPDGQVADGDRCKPGRGCYEGY